MAPLPKLGESLTSLLPRADFGSWRKTNNKEVFVVESWGEGFVVGALLIMAVITIANMRKGVFLHKLILIELLLALVHGTFCFMSFRGYGWYLSGTAALLYCSYFVHNVVAWLKIKPFFTGRSPSFGIRLSKWVTRIYLTTLALTAPVLIFQIYNNFRFFNNISTLYEKIRPYESLVRDPWWIFSVLTFFHVIRKVYSLNVFKLIRKSPRFGILLVAMLLAIVFTVLDILASTVSGLSLTDGINPYWKLALVFKSLTDNIMLDDFKSVLQRLGALKIDGSQQAMMTNSLNLSPNEKAGNILDDEDAYMEGSPNSGTGLFPGAPRMSMSGRDLEDGEDLDEYGRARRKQSMASSAVGKLGIKARKLGSFGFLKTSAEKQAQRNMEMNKRMPSISDDGSTIGRLSRDRNPSPGYRPSTDRRRTPSGGPDFGRTPAEAPDSCDFITNALDDTPRPAPRAQ